MPATIPLEELARACDGTLAPSADARLRIGSVRGMAEATPDSIIFIERPAQLDDALATPAAAFIVPPGVACETRPCIEARNPRLAFARMLRMFHPTPPTPVGIHPLATVAPSADIHPTTTVGPYAQVGEGAVLEADVVIGAHVYVGEGATVMRGTRIHPRARLHQGTRVGASCIIHAGGRIGVGAPAVIGNDVEIGANAVIGANAQVGDGTKIDNLVMIADGATIGRACILVGHSMVEPDAVLHDGSVTAAQASVRAGVRVGPLGIVAGRAVAWTDVGKGVTASGNPARPHRKELKAGAALQRLEDLLPRIERLELT